MLFINLVLWSATSLRCSSRVIETVVNFFNILVDCPSWFSGRFWLLRLGLYKLTRAKEKASDWVWIIDHTIQIGTEKCLLILGIRLSDLSYPNMCLSHEDVEPILLHPVKKSNGDVVYQQLKEAAEKTGIPREIISDKGSDLSAGINKFCQEHRETCSIYDIKHKIACLLKKQLNDDLVWKDFTRLCNETKRAIQQTELAYLCPPNQKTKSRYMNIDILLVWGRNMLTYYDSYKSKEDSDNKQKLYEELGWISEFRQELDEWDEILKVVKVVEDTIKKEGYFNGCHEKLEAKLFSEIKSEIANKFCTKLLTFVKEEESKAQLDERLLGSSEIIESVFGKLKRVESDQGKSGFTNLLLSIGAMVSTTTREVVKKALETVSTKQVLEWYKKYIGESVQSKRKKAFSFKKPVEQN